MFRDRTEAGKKLAILLKKFEDEKCIIYALPRGGVPVAYEVAVRLRKPLEALIVKKIGTPGQEELALGAVAEGEPPTFYFNTELMVYLRLDEGMIRPVIDSKLREISEIQRIYRGEGSILVDNTAIAIIVDDGIATGATMKAAINFLRSVRQRKIVVAVPVAQSSTVSEIRKMVDEVICVDTVRTMYAVGEFFGDFSQVTHEEVLQLLMNVREQLKPRKPEA